MNPSFHPSMENFDNLWPHEESLRRADELIRRSGGRVRAVSFDFFDTIVWRPTTKPTDVFCEVARRLHAEDLLPARITPEDYEVLRRHAEIKTREHQITKDPSREDISIHEIYGHLKGLVKDSEAAVRIEHSAECDLCVLNPVMAGFIRHVRALGLKTLIVSDIYFSAAQLKEILRANRFDPGVFDLVLTSCDEGVCKGTGNLFKRALKMLKLETGQMIHVGDNFLADVTGARKAGVRGCHYAQTSKSMRTILDREQFLLGGQSVQFSANSLRNMAARLFPGGTDEGFFGRAGAFLMGPLLTRYASWACDQFVAAGVRKVGALMREGELFGQLLRHEARERGLDLEITPLYLNRRSTDLAAIGRLTADNLIAWLEARCTLPVGGILKQFGLGEADFRKAPIALDEKADRPEKILELARFLFTPQIAKRIEAKSAEERRKLLDYLQPWLEGDRPLGVCDIGYSASAQTQLKHILDLEKVPTHVLGCYLVSYERAADRILDGVDIRHYLGAFGHPDFYFRAFVRSPAFMEQSLVAAMGTTLGYERQADGTVRPVLDRMPYNDTMVHRQQCFKQGVLEFQGLWHWVRRLRPGLLDGGTEFSRRVLAGIDASFVPVLGRATAFPIPEEVERFGSLALDDTYFAESYKPLCGERDLEDLRKNGYARILGEAGVHWPHGVFHKDRPRVGGEFFSVGRSLLLCNTESDDGGVTPKVTVVLHAGSQPAILGECLARLKAASDPKLELEVVLLVSDTDRAMFAAACEFGRHIMPVRICERPSHQTPLQQMNLVADSSQAPFLLFADAGVLLSPGWDGPLLKAMHSGPDIGAVVSWPQSRPNVDKDFEACASRCLLVRRTMFAEGLGFDERFTVTGAIWNFLMHLQALNYEVAACPEVVAELRRSELTSGLAGSDRLLLSRQWPGLGAFITQLNGRMTAPAQNNRAVSVDWMGSFLDHGSLSHVNRELAAALKTLPGIHLQRVSNGAAAVNGFEKLACEISATASSDAAVTVRHAWPPEWKRPRNGRLVVIQPWEFGALPEQWVKASASVDEFWVPSEYVRRVYIESGVAADKVVVVPNGVDPERFHPQAAPMKLATQKKFKFLFVGGTIFRKGPDLLLKAYLERFTAADDVCLVIKDFGGTTVYAGQTIEAQIQAAQAQPNAPEILYLNGEMPPESLPGLYTACDCLILPYRGEGFGLPALEAMACGLAVIVTAGGATDDFVQDDFGWRIPARRGLIGREISGMKLSADGWLLEPDVAALGHFMREAFANPAETHQRGQLGARHARECCAWKHSAAIAAQRIRELASKSSGTAVVTKTVVLKKSAPVKTAITLPPCALVGHLAGAREMVRQKNLRGGWKAVLEMLAQRPFHPEAYLELAEIANIAGDGQRAKFCAEYARHMAPGWKPAKKFLNQRLKNGARPDWLKLPDALENPKSEMPGRLSVCLIVKNEERFLGQCLKSVQGLASQIVVVDTGSTDRTVAIAKEYGAEVYSFAWCDDFSAARNAALEHATGEWVLMLDADEELSADGREKVRQALKDSAVLAWRLPLINVGREAEGCSYVPRLFRNAPGLFYIGRVHEQVFSSIEVRREEWGLENRLGDATLVHHGYTAEMTRDRNKVERNLHLLEKAIEELPDEPHLLMNYGLELARSGRESEALARYQEAFDSLSSKPVAEIVPELRESLLTQLCARLTAAKQYAGVVRALTSPLAGMQGGLTASLHFSLGLAHIEMKQFREAAEQMRQCLDKRNQASLTPINLEIRTAAPCHCLALCLSKLGETTAAEKAFQEGLGDAGHGDELRIDYARFLVEQNRPVDALAQLNGVVSKNALHLGAWQLGGQIALSRPEFLEFARDWTQEAMRHVFKDPTMIAQRAEALMLSGDTAGALELWQGIPDAASSPAVLAALILCETVESPTTHAPQEGEEEAAASRAFIGWYQKLIAAKTFKTITKLNEQTDKLSRALPGAARMLETAMAEASRAGTSAKG